MAKKEGGKPPVHRRGANSPSAFRRPDAWSAWAGMPPIRLQKLGKFRPSRWGPG